MKRVLIILAVAALAPLAVNAASSTNPVSDAVRHIVGQHAKILIASAEEMPADKYSYHPTPQQMTFGHLVMHIAESNDFFCSRISGETAPKRQGLKDTDPKPTLVNALKASFEFCSSALSKVNDQKLSEEVPFFGGRSVTRAAAMILMTDDLYDHYSTAAGYLRLNGLLPPTAQHRHHR